MTHASLFSGIGDAELALWLEEDPKKRSSITNDAFEHTNPFGEERNIKVTMNNDHGAR